MILKQIPGYNEYITDNGHVFRKNKKGKLVEVKYNRSINKTNKVYIDVCLHLEGKKRGTYYRLGRALARTFLDETLDLSYKKDKRVVDYLDNNSENNTVSNIQITTQSENLKAAKYRDNTNIGRHTKCYAYNVFTKEAREYNSTHDLVKDIFNKDNNGYFSFYSKNKSQTTSGWRVGYTLEEIKENIND